MQQQEGPQIIRMDLHLCADGSLSSPPRRSEDVFSEQKKASSQDIVSGLYIP